MDGFVRNIMHRRTTLSTDIYCVTVAETIYFFPLVIWVKINELGCIIKHSFTILKINIVCSNVFLSQGNWLKVFDNNLNSVLYTINQLLQM